MNKIYYFLISIALICGLSACSDTKEDPYIEKDGTVDLSQPGLANCYIVQKPGIYKFKADNMFNQGEGLPVPPEINPMDATLVWQSVESSVSSVELIEGKEGEKPYIKFQVDKAEGNALIAALDEDGNIVWSWHIWMPKDQITSVSTSTGYEVMNMNLGAMNNTPGDAASYGMLYQWGRKDPFPAAATLTGDTQTVGAPLYDIDNNPVSITYSSWYSNDVNTMEYSIANPTEVISNFSQYSSNRDWLKESDDTLWGNPKGDLKDGENNYIYKGAKTCYDPSPYGWRVAPADVFSDFTSTGGYVWNLTDLNVADSNKDGLISIEDYNYGWQFLMKDLTPLYFPAAARYDGSYAMLMGSMSGLWGNYWSNAPYRDSSDTKGLGYSCLSFQVKTQTGADVISASPSAGGSKADAYSVRCIRD